MNFTPVIITCPGREAMLEQTLSSWRATDFVAGNPSPVSPLVQEDCYKFERRQERQEHNSLAALQLALKCSGSNDFILFMEDDIIYNRHLRHDLEHWLPLLMAQRDIGLAPMNKVMFFASLYDCTIRELEVDKDNNYFIADPNAVYGSQCYIVSVPLARYMVEHWWEVPGMQDIKMSRLAARHCPIYYHTPSLVQHVGVKSVWGGRFHDTKDYDAEFKACPSKTFKRCEDSCK